MMLGNRHNSLFKAIVVNKTGCSADAKYGLCLLNEATPSLQLKSIIICSFQFILNLQSENIMNVNEKYDDLLRLAPVIGEYLQADMPLYWLCL